MRTEIITESNRTPNQTHSLTAERPVKYPPVTRQYCRPQTVNRASSTSTIRVNAAEIAQAFRIQSSDGTSSLPQSIDGLYGSNVALLPAAAVPGKLPQRRTGATTAALAQRSGQPTVPLCPW